MDQEQSIQFARKYLEDILAFFGLNTVVDVSFHEEVIELTVPSTHLNGFLIGQGGATLRALQSLITLALRQKGAQIDRVSLDIADYKKQHAERIAEQVEEWAKQVQETSEPFVVRPMSAADRRTVHSVITEKYPSLKTTSDGEDRERHVVISLAE